MTLIDYFKITTPEKYPNLRMLQKAIYKVASVGGDNSISAARCAEIFSRSELFAIFLDTYEKVEFKNPDMLENYSPIGDLALKAEQLTNYIRNAIGESRDFLPISLTRVIEDFFSPESSVTNLNVVLLMILAVNIQ